MNPVQMSIAGTCIIIVTIVIRALAVYKLPKRTFLALWGIAFARLVLPFSVPSPFGLFALIQRSGPAIQTKMAAVSAHGTGTLSTAAPTTVWNRSFVNVPPVSSTLSAWYLIWLMGLGISALLFVLSGIHWRRVFRRSESVDNAFTRAWLKAHPLRRPISVRQSDSIMAPLTYGVFRPVILVPTNMDWSEVATLQYVFAHEFTHIRRFDALIKLALAAAPCIHWFNPLVWVMYVLANRDIELACDEAVIRSIGKNARKSYASALLDLEERRSGFAMPTNGFSGNAIEERIKAIMKMKKITLPAILLAILLIIGMATAFATSAPAETAAENKLVVSHVEDAIEQPGEAADYSIYEPYGLRYDAENQCYTYNGIVVGFFNDPNGGVSFTDYFSGAIELEAEYDADGNLIGIRECSPETYAQHAEKRARFARSNGSSDHAEEAARTGALPDDLAWLAQYAPYGITYDAAQRRLNYLGRQVKTLLDPENSAIYLSDLGETCLVISRDNEGAICSIDECEEYQAQALMRSTIPQGGDLTVETSAEAPAIDEAAMTETALRRLAEHYPEMEEWVRSQYPDAVWWTVEGYSAWMTWEEARIASQFGQTVGWNSSGVATVDQAYIEEQQALHQELLRRLAEGMLVSKSVDGNENLGLTINPQDWENGRIHEYELAVQLRDSTEVHFGPYETADELLAEFISFSEAAIAAGNFDEREANEIIEFYKSKE